MAIFRAALARNATFLRALIGIASPVAGLRPTRAARFRTRRIPRPAIFTCSPFLRCFLIIPASSSNISRPCFLVRSCCVANVKANVLVVIVEAVMGFVPSCTCVPCISLMRFAGFGPITEWVASYEIANVQLSGIVNAHGRQYPLCQGETVGQNLAKAVSRTVRGCPGVILLLPSADAQ